MPKGYPGTGPYAGRRRHKHEARRRAGALSRAEQNVIGALAADQPSDVSEKALERQVDRLARVLRRSPAAVKGQLDRAKAQLQARQVDYANLHFRAATIAADRGDGRPSEWALMHGRSVEPVGPEESGPQVIVHLGMVLPGLLPGNPPS